MTSYTRTTGRRHGRDLDHFKLVNAIGHAIGDEVLRRPSTLARSSLRAAHGHWIADRRMRIGPRSPVLTAGVHMTDKHRHRRTHAPHGQLPNWLLFVFFACAVAIAGLARSII